MLWSTMLSKIGRMPMSIANHQHVHARLYNPNTGKLDVVFLDIKYDAHGNPYLIQDPKNHEDPIIHKRNRKQVTNQ